MTYILKACKRCKGDMIVSSGYKTCMYCGYEEEIDVKPVSPDKRKEPRQNVAII